MHLTAVTLHGGIYGWDRRNWTMAASTQSSVSYKHVDNADVNFPSVVTAFATHTVGIGGVLRTLQKLLLQRRWMQRYLGAQASVVELNDLAIPTGKFINVTDTPFDFRQVQAIGARWNDTIDLCGSGYQGYDKCWVYDKPGSGRVGASLWSEKSGIRVDITTNQPAVQVYTAFWMNTIRKTLHGGPDLRYESWPGVAIE